MKTIKKLELKTYPVGSYAEERINSQVTWDKINELVEIINQLSKRKVV